jgi:RNA polymerase sigma-70 factor (ECF subfamily)
MPETIDELFVKALNAHTRRLLAIARAIVGNRASAEDVVQQAVTNLYQHRERYDWRDPGPLMRRSVVNEALRLLRQPRMSLVADDHPGPGRSHESPVGGMIDAETIQKVRQAIQTLPEHFRAALVLCEYEGMSYNQIAEVLDASVPQVKTWLHRGRRQLAVKLKDFMGVND